LIPIKGENVIYYFHVVLMLAPIKQANQTRTRSHERMTRDTQKINCVNTHGKVAKG
jgi:hypothetical protein